MSFASYAALREAVAGWMNRDDLTARIPDFITMTEAILTRRIDHRQMIAVKNITIQNATYSLPDDFTGIKSLRLDVTTKPRLDFMTVDAYANRDSRTGNPEFYTIADGKLFFYPEPTDTITGQLIYNQQIPALSLNGSNWLLESFPDVYLYGALTQAAPYMADDDRVSLWKNLFEQAIEEICADGKAQSFGGTIQTNNGAVQVY